jgi:hypothetical protein
VRVRREIKEGRERDKKRDKKREERGRVVRGEGWVRVNKIFLKRERKREREREREEKD